MLYPMVDTEGYFLEDVLVEDSFVGTRELEGKGTIISSFSTPGLYKPRWDFEKEIWIEGMSAEEIEQLQHPSPDPNAPETVEQKLHRLEQADLNNKELIATLYEIMIAK